MLRNELECFGMRLGAFEASIDLGALGKRNLAGMRRNASNALECFGMLGNSVASCNHQRILKHAAECLRMSANLRESGVTRLESYNY